MSFRSAAWFGTGPTGGTLRAFSHRSRMRQLGYLPAEHEGKPVIAILNTWSDINPCHMHLRERAEQVKRGVWQAGGFPLEFPVATLSETFQKPTPMLYRNLLAMEAEEILRSYPVDGAVLMGGCDKTIPALLMGAASADLPAIVVPGGPMLSGHYRGTALGSGTDLWAYWDEHRAGRIGECELAEVAAGLARSPGHCMTMGTASTMTSAAEALGMALPGLGGDPRRRLGPSPDGGPGRGASGRPGPGRRDPAAGHELRGVPGRGGGRPRPRRLDQRPHPPDRDGRPRRGDAHPGGLRHHRRPGPGARQRRARPAAT